jgi:hypothetical protein
LPLAYALVIETTSAATNQQPRYAAQIVLTPEPTRFLILAVMVDFD